MKPVDIEELEAIVEKLKDSPLEEKSHEKLRGVVDCYRYLAELAGEEGATIEDVRERFFERYKSLLARDEKAAGAGGSTSDPDATG